MVIPAALMLLLLTMGVVNAGGRWSGIDPIAKVNNHIVNVEVDVPSGQWCNIKGDILVTIFVPDLKKAKFMSESEGDEQFCNVMTRTTLKEHNGDKNTVYVSTFVNGKGKFAVDFLVGVDGEEVGVFGGHSGETVMSDPISLGDNDRDDDKHDKHDKRNKHDRHDDSDDDEHGKGHKKAKKSKRHH